MGCEAWPERNRGRATWGRELSRRSIFNLLPIPPLDGSRIVEEILPFSFRSVWNRICSARFALLIALFIAPSIFGFGIGDWVMDLSARLTGR